MRLRPPVEVRARVGRDRLLGWTASGTSSLVATDTALLLPVGEEPERVPWDLVLRVTWNEDAVEITAQASPGGRPVTHRVPVGRELGGLPDVVRERVNASIVVQHHVELEGERGARLVARRAPGSADLRWSVVFDAGLDPSDPDLRERADRALADLRASLGI